MNNINIIYVIKKFLRNSAKTTRLLRFVPVAQNFYPLSLPLIAERVRREGHLTFRKFPAPKIIYAPSAKSARNYREINAKSVLKNYYNE